MKRTKLAQAADARSTYIHSNSYQGKNENLKVINFNITHVLMKKVIKTVHFATNCHFVENVIHGYNLTLKKTSSLLLQKSP